METPLHVPKGVNYLSDYKPDENKFHPMSTEHKDKWDYAQRELNRNLDQDKLIQELQFIKDELHCNAIRIAGHSSHEAIKTAIAAKKVGINPWLSPRFWNATFDENAEMLEMYCEEAKENGLEEQPLIVANELAIECAEDPITGEFISFDYDQRNKYMTEKYWRNGTRIDATERVKKLMQTARKSGWKGPLTYAALPNENVDWDQINDPNVIVAVNQYWSMKNWETGEPMSPEDYDARIKEVIAGAHGRPVVITEFGAVPQDSAVAHGGGASHLDGPLNYNAQAESYERYLQVLQDNNVGYFAYAFHEFHKEYGQRYNKSYGIVNKGPTGMVDQLTPAAQVLARYNEKAATVAGSTILED